MSSIDASTTRKKIKTGDISLDVEERAIVVSYETEVSALNKNGDPVVIEKKTNQKRLRLKSIDQNTNVPQLAQEVIASCKLIHPSKLPLVQQLLDTLKQHVVADKKSDKEGKQRVEMQEKRQQGRKNSRTSKAQASLSKLDTYIEKLYEDTEQQIEAGEMILDLARSPPNLEQLLQDETLITALARLLKDEARKDIDLTTVIIEIFLCFAHYSQFHAFISQNRVGDTCLRLIEREMDRRAVLDNDLATSKLNLNNSNKETRSQALDAHERVKQRVAEMKQKQEYLLCACFHVLLNLAEDVQIERKMKKRKIVSYLVQVLDAGLPDLLLVVLTFLKKLSIFKENKNEMGQSDIIAKLTRFVPFPDDAAILNVALRLLLNLSFDSELLEAMIKCSYVPKLVALLKTQANQREIILKLLYQLSMEDKHRSTFAYTDIVPLLMKLILDNQDEKIGKEVIALAINLTLHPRNAAMVAPETVPMLIKKVQRTRDPLLMKMIRNLASHEGPCKELISDSVRDLIHLTQNIQSADFQVEVLGTLGNLISPTLDWGRLVQEYNLLDFLAKFLAPRAAEDDIVLEVVILIGTIAMDKTCSPLVIQSPLINSLAELIVIKQDDDEIVLQCVYTFFRLLHLPEAREHILKQTQIGNYLLDLLYDRNPEISKMANLTLDLIMDFDTELAKRMVKTKFEKYNSQWIQAVQSSHDDSSIQYYNDSYEQDDFDDDYDDYEDS
eukprot:TRINITY_DN2863_c0_g1_i1.p1 TRINITY_DN2863_c0_g1~~TRINITY_DN2863_c0_g1_i1.p1  ORF type:complete len:726 (-),score=148.27 TRINITY_DN2863_c0_g1_i1:132-2309(-)